MEVRGSCLSYASGEDIRAGVLRLSPTFNSTRGSKSPVCQRSRTPSQARIREAALSGWEAIVTHSVSVDHPTFFPGLSTHFSSAGLDEPHSASTSPLDAIGLRPHRVDFKGINFSKESQEKYDQIMGAGAMPRLQRRHKQGSVCVDA